MNMNELAKLLQKLYPADMIKEAEADRQKRYTRAVKKNWLIPSKQYMQTPIVLQMFKSDFCTMNDPTMNCMNAKQELSECKESYRQDEQARKEVAEPNTCLDTSFYTPEYFQNVKRHTEQQLHSIKSFQKTLEHPDDMYMIFSSGLSANEVRKPLTRSVVKLTIASAVYAKRCTRKNPLSFMDTGRAVAKVTKQNPEYKTTANRFYKEAAEAFE